MCYHIGSIDAPECLLSCKDGQLTCKSAKGNRQVPLEDVGAIIITSFSASIHSKLLLEAAKYGIGLVICENFKPASLVLPANRSTDALLPYPFPSLHSSPVDTRGCNPRFLNQGKASTGFVWPDRITTSRCPARVNPM